MDTHALAVRAGELLTQLGLTLSVAESCTGGLLGAIIVDVPGSSKYFEGGAITYSNRLKEQILRVPVQILAQFGAVSAETATAMAHNARLLFATDVALSVTGIAGPGGGTPQKPVGLTYVALATAAGETHRRYVFEGSRRENREQAVRAAFELLLEALKSASGEDS